MVLAAELAGCNDAGATSPTAAALPQPTPTPAPPTPSGPGYAVADVTLSGVVFEMTPTGRVPIEGARVYLADDQDIGTDTNGFFSFRPVWVCPCTFYRWLAADHTNTSVTKVGYTDPPGQPALPGLKGPGWRVVSVYGDTRLDIQLVRR
jgi:hypothetical protein